MTKETENRIKKEFGIKGQIKPGWYIFGEKKMHLIYSNKNNYILTQGNITEIKGQNTLTT